VSSHARKAVDADVGGPTSLRVDELDPRHVRVCIANRQTNLTIDASTKLLKTARASQLAMNANRATARTTPPLDDRHEFRVLVMLRVPRRRGAAP
jgi:hypothetical protein